MNILYILGSGILDNPNRWELLLLIVTSTGFVCSLLFTVWLLVTSMVARSLHPKIRYVIGVVLTALFYFLFQYSCEKYDAAVDAQKTSSTPFQKCIVWTVREDTHGNICIYENI